MDFGMFKKKKTDNVIEVLPGAGNTLHINDHDVFQNSLKQVITWKLAKQLEQGDFVSFEWVDPTAASGTFDAPEIAPDGNSITIGDHNGPSGKKGNLAYIIKVEMNGTIYTSRTTSEDLMVKDPIIINK
jgi:hypothetical protein